MTSLAARNRVVATRAALFGLAMLALAFASVPLYRLFCQVTGFAGTTQRAEAAPGAALGESIRVRFDANVAGGLPWRFEPIDKVVTVVPGKATTIRYRATNLVARTTVGTATFNVSPDQSGSYFNKIQCFCFSEQELKGGQSVEMPVTFFVDPKLRDSDDPFTREIDEITLSYTFYPVESAGAAR